MEGEGIRGLAGAMVIGIGATAVMDLWAMLQKRLFGVPSLDYRLLGRWIGHFPGGRFVHEAIGKAEPVPGEAPLGWIAHYAIGVLFAGLLLSIWGLEWARCPTILPALIVGLGSIVAPFLVMQPGFGFGLAAAKTPTPWTFRFRSLVAHGSFVIGLYLSGLVAAWVLHGPVCSQG